MRLGEDNRVRETSIRLILATHHTFETGNNLIVNTRQEAREHSEKIVSCITYLSIEISKH